MSLSTIVVGVDFSPLGERALAHAAALARAHDADVVVVHASGIDAGGMYVYEIAGRVDEPWKAYVHARLEHGRERLRAVADELTAAGLRARPRHAQGFPDASLVEVAEEEGADLIVVGTHGRTGVERWLLGSVAERVVRHAERDVFVVRGEPAAGRYRRILVPTDFSPISSGAIDRALEIAAPGARVDLLHCWHEPFTLRDEAPGWLRDRLVARAREQGDQLIRSRGGEAVALELEVVEGDPAAMIHDRLQRGAYDCAVLGSHGRRGVRRMVLGSVAEHIVRHAPCSVFVAHPPR